MAIATGTYPDGVLSSVAMPDSGTGVYLVGRRDVPARVVIDEYVAVSGAFFGGDEPGFVNAALDRMAHRKRAPEFGEPVPDGEIGF